MDARAWQSLRKLLGAAVVAHCVTQCAADSSPPSGTAYKLVEDGGLCPTGFQPVLDASGCFDAGVSYALNWYGEVAETASVAGCYTSGSYVFFNQLAGLDYVLGQNRVCSGGAVPPSRPPPPPPPPSHTHHSAVAATPPLPTIPSSPAPPPPPPPPVRIQELAVGSVLLIGSAVALASIAVMVYPTVKNLLTR